MSALYEIERLSFRYPKGARDVLHNVSLTVSEGEVLAVLGPNGAGKSTLLDCMAALAAPAAGSLRLGGRELHAMRPDEVARIVGYVPQSHSPAFAYTVLDFVLLGRAPHLGALRRPGRKDVDSGLAALDALGIPHLADKPYTEISGGERQQAQIARAVCQDPRIILFDEPTAHLDYGNQHRILLLAKRLAAQGFSAVITTHNPDHALLLGGRAAVLGQDGSLVCGEAAEMITEPRMRALYKTQMRIAFVPEAGRVCCLAPALQE